MNWLKSDWVLNSLLFEEIDDYSKYVYKKIASNKFKAVNCKKINITHTPCHTYPAQAINSYQSPALHITWRFYINIIMFAHCICATLSQHFSEMINVIENLFYTICMRNRYLSRTGSPPFYIKIKSTRHSYWRLISRLVQRRE